ncbi:hypothetical protein [Lacunisphaera limnophila]|uniref:hypothetical protein n=1 Tax=Lacunisphaera limnophila TaxID=1838286 RepID=UPI0012FE3C51|nr:hypothetical protein [Lacunisphaera limnophila]
MQKSVTLSQRFDTGVAGLWHAAGHPRLVSGNVPMLRSFFAPTTLRIGTPVAETHTILGWPQKYLGHITHYAEGQTWGMSSSPAERGPLPLPHDVMYEFEPDGRGSQLRVSCRFDCLGILGLPLISNLVEWYMKRAIAKVFDAARMNISRSQAANDSDSAAVTQS